MKRILCAAAAIIATTAGAFIPLQAIAQVGISVIIGNPPPPVRYERIPPPRDGYIWAPGYWDWDGHQHIWAPGHWEPMRGDGQYYQPQWRQGPHGWELDRGGWRPRDGGHDGRWHDHHDDRHDHHDDRHGDHHDDRHDDNRR